MSTTDATVEQLEEVVEPVAAAATDARKMFKYSEYLHVGEGAADCEHATDGQCEDPEHFHAWCRLPNPLQHEDIRKKSLAAKARRVRMFDDPESDESVVLDQQLKQINDPAYQDTIIDELLAREFAEDYQNALQDVQDMEEFEHIFQDREELARLEDAEGELPEAERSSEYRALVAHQVEWVEAVKKRMAELQDPRRDEMRGRAMEDLISMVREKRVEEAADEMFINTYNLWTWFVGTYRVNIHESLRRPYLQMWEEIGTPTYPKPGTMVSERRDVIEALRQTFGELQVAMQRAASGN